MRSPENTKLVSDPDAVAEDKEFIENGEYDQVVTAFYQYLCVD